jgi:hypothetical protein
MYDATNVALLLGVLTLTSWIIGGAVSVLSSGDKLHRTIGLVAVGLHLFGLASAIAMAATLVLT